MDGDNRAKIRQRMAAWNLFSRMTKDELDERLPAGAMLRSNGNKSVPMGFKPSDKLTGLVLYQAADAEGYVYLSISTICSRSFLSRQTVRDALKKLIAAKMIKIVKGGEKNGTATTYKVRYQ